MRASYTNRQMDEMAQALAPLLGRTDLLGYAAARNVRVLTEEAREYIAYKNELLAELGDHEVGEDGRPTGMVTIGPESAHYDEFCERVSAWADVAHEPDVFTVPASEAVGVLSGEQFLSLWWMFDHGGDAS